MRNVAWVFIVVGTSCALCLTERSGCLVHSQLRICRSPWFPHLPWTASPGADGWTVFHESGQGDRTFVYTRSRAFRCASAVNIQEVRQARDRALADKRKAGRKSASSVRRRNDIA